MRQELRKELRVMKQERSGLLVLLGRGSCMLLLSFVQVCKGFNDINGVVGNGSLGIKCSGGSVGVDLGKCGRLYNVPLSHPVRLAGWNVVCGRRRRQKFQRIGTGIGKQHDMIVCSGST